MSCIPMVGKFPKGGGPNLPRSTPMWTERKRKRLESFAHSVDPWMRAIAAEHPRIATNLLVDLLQDDVAHVRRCAAKNVSMTPELFELLLGDEDPGIVAYARFQMDDMVEEL